jgi:hypothetical protein
MKRRLLAGVTALVVILGGITEPCPARADDLPVIIPDLPQVERGVRNPISFDQLHHFTGGSGDGKGLHIDLMDLGLQGTIYVGPYPFDNGQADYNYARYRFSTPLKNGKGDLPVSSLLETGYNVNNWPQGNGPLPPTMTLAYRLDLWRVVLGIAKPYGFYDGLVSFLQQGESYAKQMTIVEGPFLTGVDSWRPDRVTIVWRTDRPTAGRVLLSQSWSSDSPEAQCSSQPPMTQVIPSPDDGTLHSVTLTGLRPGSLHYYSVQSETGTGESAYSPVYWFRTHPLGHGPVRFAFACDSVMDAGGGERDYMGLNLKESSLMAQDAFRREVDLMIFAGDLINGYTSSVEDYRLQLRGWKQAWSGFWRHKPVYPTLGNHETLINV